MQKKFYPFLFLLIITYNLKCIDVCVTDVKVNAFPLVKVEFFAFQTDGTILRNFGLNNLSLTEDGIPRTLISAECQPLENPQEYSLSSVLTIDVSGSMDQDEPKRLDIAKSAATIWVNGMNLATSECAITSFDHLSYINRDFTQNINLLTNAINSLKPQGGTNYNNALLYQPAGALNLFTHAIPGNRRVLVFLTDGVGDCNAREIVNLAQSLNVKVYAITIGMTCPDSLKYICNETGGKYFSSISKMSEALLVYRQILAYEKGYKPCSFQWYTDYTCAKGRNIKVWMSDYNYEFKYNYVAHTMPVPSLRYVQTTVRMAAVPPGSYSDTIVILKAYDYPLRVDGLTFDNNKFSVVDWGGLPPPFIMNPNTVRNIKVRYTPTDSSVQSTIGKVNSTACFCEDLFLICGYDKRTVVIPTRTIKVLEPNGGEILSSCDSIKIRWEGVSDNDSVCIEYSSNGGEDWKVIKNIHTGSKFLNWLPPTVSDKYLMRVTQIRYLPDSVVKITPHTGAFAVIAVNPVNRKLVAVGDSPNNSKEDLGSVSVFNTETGALIKKLELNPPDLNAASIAWSKDGTKLAAASTSDKALLQVWNTSDYSLDFALNMNSMISAIEFSNNSQEIIVAMKKQSLNLAVIHVQTRTIERYLTYHDAPVNWAQFSYDGARLVSCDQNGRAVVWNTSTWDTVRVLVHSSGEYISQCCFNSASNNIVYTIGNELNKWDVPSAYIEQRLYANHLRHISSNSAGTKLVLSRYGSTQILNASNITLNPLTSYAHGGCFSQMSLFINDTVASVGDGICISLWNSANGNLYKSIKSTAKSGVKDAQVSYDGAIVASVSDADRTVVISNSYTGAMINSFIINTDYSTYGLRFNRLGDKIIIKTLYSWFVYNIANGQLFSSSLWDCWGVSNADFSTDGTLVLTNGNEGLKVYSIDGTFQYANVSFISSNVFSIKALADNTHAIVSGSSTTSKRVALWNYRDNSLVWMNECGNNVGNGDGSDDGMLFSAPCGDDIIIYDRYGIEALVDTTFCPIVKMSPNGAHYAMFDPNEQCLKINETTKGNTIKLIYPELLTVPFPIGNYSPDGSRLVTYGKDGNVCVWDVQPPRLQCDSSDAQFAVAEPVLDQIVEINFGIRHTNEQCDTVVTAVFCNNSDIDIVLDSLYFNHAPKFFKIVNSGANDTIHSGECFNLELSFAPNAPMQYNDSLLFIAGCLKGKIMLTGIGSPPWVTTLTPVIDFGKVPLGSYKDTIDVLTVKNTSPSVATIRSAIVDLPDTTSFSILVHDTPYLLSRDSVYKMSLRFEPTDIGLTTAKLVLDDNNDALPAQILLIGEGVGSAMTTEKTDTVLINIWYCDTSYISAYYQLYNIGTAPLVIKDYSLSNYSDSVEFEGLSPDTRIQPNSFGKIEIKVKKKYAGVTTCNLDIMTNAVNLGPDSTKHIVLIIIKDSVNLAISEDKIDFGVVFGSATKEVQIENTGEIAIRIDSIAFGSEKFILDEPSLPLIVSPGNTETFSFRYSTSDTAAFFSYCIIYTNFNCMKYVIDLSGGSQLVPGYSRVNNDLKEVKIAFKPCIDEEIDTIVKLYSTGNKIALINSIYFKGAGADAFETVFLEPFPIAAGDSTSLMIHIRNDFQGIKNAELVIRTNSDSADSVIVIPFEARRDSAAFELADNSIQFGTIAGVFAEKTIDIVNKGDIDLLITAFITSNSNFQIVSPTLPFTLPSGDSRTLTIRFSPTDTTEQNCYIVINSEYFCVFDTLFSSGKKTHLPVSADFAIGTATGYSGDIVEIPVYVVHKENISANDAINVTAVISYNGTLLMPMWLSQSEFEGSVRTTNIEFPLNKEEGEIIASLKFKAALGNAESTDISMNSIVSPEVFGAAFTCQTGKFELLGICKDGGTRLVNPSFTNDLITIIPNPVSETVNLNVIFVENGYSSIKIINNTGKLVKLIYSGYPDLIEQNFWLDLSALSTGMYYVVLQTPTLIKSKKFCIIK